MKRFPPLLAVLLGMVLPSPALERPVVVSVYQGPTRDGDFAANLATCRAVVDQARARGSHFVLFPAGFLSGHGSPLAIRQGARSLSDPQLREFIAASTDHATVILVGLARAAGTNLFDSVLVIHRGRLLGFHDRVQSTAADRDLVGVSPGSSLPVFEAHGARFGVLVGSDAETPHLALAEKLQGAEILFAALHEASAPADLDARRQRLRNSHAGLASLFQVAVARANAVRGDEPGPLVFGDSAILGPRGNALIETGLFRTELGTALLTPLMFQADTSGTAFLEAPGWLRTGIAELLSSYRPAPTAEALHGWLENMAVDHRFSREEMAAVTGLDPAELDEALRRWNLVDPPPRTHDSDQPLRLLPYPGGRHPRLGFFDGARNPQRETKVSVFAPWADGGYAVVDVPEAIFSNLGLIYLAHTHIPTLWDLQGLPLPRLEWEKTSSGEWVHSRTLPNGIAFGAGALTGTDGVRFRLWLRNGTSEKLTGLRVQNCVMLARASGFAAQSLTNKVFAAPFAAARSAAANRWILTAWESCGRTWGNELVPCIHSDPVFPDCPPGETVRLNGWLSFYEGSDVLREIERLTRLGLPSPPAP